MLSNIFGNLDKKITKQVVIAKTSKYKKASYRVRARNFSSFSLTETQKA